MESSGILGSIGFSIAQVSFVLITLPHLYQLKKKYEDCRSLLNDYKLSLEASESKYRNWEMVWRRFDTAAYQTIWLDKYEDILTARQRIHDLSQSTKKRIQGVTKDLEAPPTRWKIFKSTIGIKSDEELKTWKRVLFALSTDVTIKKHIEDLKTAIDNITLLCQHEFSRRIGTTRLSTPTLEDTERLVQLLFFFSPFTQRAKDLYEARRIGRISRETHSWTVEIGRHDGARNVKEWEHWDPVVVRFAFNAFPTGLDGDIMSMCVEHNRDLHDGSVPPGFPSIDWQHAICGNGNPTQGVSKEPWPISQRCRSFGRLFRDGIFEDEATLMSWTPRRAELILSLTNWVFLLWDTPWTADLCSLGLRSVCDAPALKNDLAVRLNTLGVDFQHRTDCNHAHDNKLLSFGILVAELLTTTPIRQAPRIDEHTAVRYQKWNREVDDWEPISVRQLVTMVRDKSGSADMRDVVSYCLDEANVRTPRFEAGYMLEYISKLYEPIERWCEDELDAYEELDVEDWTSAALESPAPAQDVISPQTAVKPNATHGVVGVCVLLFVLSTAASMWA
ncbi:hypothetical protein PFICI_08102 [Pestalotiopsis fici W106-1]|uniref:Uncharacterized protein n=1 Tax=Pestalotiopsis fici (strain W106-1 / CGMCC3.15140) TaxID=1229662 RepID=W3X357_PESFW|nr:uncharacterized protein PFICI_08102 [Pestalotiopsis fici W106-1]ETS80573.1 hypothetical protein PFICI_08102 [Pestalotiopsis fici W106-1]